MEDCMKRFSGLLILAVLLASVAFAAGGQQGAAVSGGSAYPEINGGRPITLLVDLEGFAPTLNTVPTVENPVVRVAGQRLADKFMSYHPNVKIEWVRNKVGNTVDQFAEWWTTQIAGGTAPAIGRTQNSAYQERDWYWNLTPALDTPNQYLPGNTRWKDQFPDYLWERASNTSMAGWIQAIPLRTPPGPATAYFYNKDLFDKLNLKPPTSFEDLRIVSKALKNAGYLSLVPWTNETPYSFNWPYQFVVPPSYIYAIFDKIDYNGNGTFETTEQLRAVKAGLFNPVEQESMREMMYLMKEVYLDLYIPGWETADQDRIWNSGNVGMKAWFVGSIPDERSNTNRNFEFGVVPAPTVTSATSKFVKDIPFTQSGPYQPSPDSWNIIKPVVENNRGMEEAAIAFMKFITVPENLSELILENGFALGTVRGVLIPPALESFMAQPFPILPNGAAPRGFTTEMNQAMSRELEMWVKGQTNDATFFANWNRYQQQGADDSIRINRIDTTGW